MNKQEDTWNVQQVVVSHVRGVHAYQTQCHALRRCTEDWVLLNTRLVDVQSTSYVANIKYLTRQETISTIFNGCSPYATTLTVYLIYNDRNKMGRSTLVSKRVLHP